MIVDKNETHYVNCLLLVSVGGSEGLDFKHRYLYSWAWGHGQVGQAWHLVHGPWPLGEEGEVRGRRRRQVREVWARRRRREVWEGEVRERGWLWEVRHIWNRRQDGGRGWGLQHVWKEQMRSPFCVLMLLTDKRCRRRWVGGMDGEHVQIGLQILSHRAGAHWGHGPWTDYCNCDRLIF